MLPSTCSAQAPANAKEVLRDIFSWLRLKGINVECYDKIAHFQRENWPDGWCSFLWESCAPEEGEEYYFPVMRGAKKLGYKLPLWLAPK